MVGDKFVQQDEADQERAFQRAFTLEAILNGILFVIAAVALPFVALAYGEPEILLPGLVLLVVIPAATLQSPLWVFYRQMRFLEQRRLQAVDPVVAFVVTVALAAAGRRLLEPRHRDDRGQARRRRGRRAGVAVPARVRARPRRAAARVRQLQHAAVRRTARRGSWACRPSCSRARRSSASRAPG